MKWVTNWFYGFKPIMSLCQQGYSGLIMPDNWDLCYGSFVKRMWIIFFKETKQWRRIVRLPNILTDEHALNESLKVGGCSRDNRQTPETLLELKVHSGIEPEQCGET